MKFISKLIIVIASLTIGGTVCATGGTAESVVQPAQHTDKAIQNTGPVKIKIKDRTGRNVEFEINQAIARESGLLKTMLDVSETQEDVALPENNICAEDFRVILDIMRIINNEKQDNNNPLPAVLQRLEHIKDLHQLSDLFMAANYLDIPTAFHAFVQKISSNQELRQRFTNPTKFQEWLQQFPFARIKELNETVGSNIFNKGYFPAFTHPFHSSLSPVVVTPNGNIIISGSMDRSARVWTRQADGQYQQQQVLNHTVPSLSVAITPDGNTIVFGSFDTSIQVWTRQADGQYRQQQILNGHTGCVVSVAITPNGNTIISGCTDRSARVWTRQGNGQYRQQQILDHIVPVLSVAVTSDGNTFVFTSIDNSVRVWTRQNDGQYRQQQVLNGHTNGVDSVAITPDGNTIISSSEDGTVRVWTRQNDGQYRQQQILNSHTDHVESAAIAITPDGNTIVLRSGPRTLRVLTRQDDGQYRQQQILDHIVPVLSVAITLDGNTIVSGSEDQTVHVWKSIQHATHTTIEQALFIEHCMNLSERQKWDIRGSEYYQLVFATIMTEQPEFAEYLRRYLILE